MSSIIKVNNIQNQCGANIIKEDSNTITLGASGDTIALASGASQTGFGRTGTVDWQTTIKTGDFTAVNGEGYFVNTTSGEIDVTLPASPSAGNIVSLKDYARTWNTNNCIVLRNGSNMDGNAANQTFSTAGLTLTFIYMDATRGWSLINDDETTSLGATFITGSGGTVTTCGNFKIHTFTGPGTFTVCSVGNAAGSNTVDYVVVAGGAGAGGDAGGGGGGGGTRFSDGTASGCYTAGPSPLSASALPVSAQGYPITVGSGGAGTPGPASPGPSPSNKGNNGVNSVFSTITSTGGGGGGGHGPGTIMQGNPGGSGGGSRSAGACAQGGLGNTPPVSPPQGNNGGTGNPQPAQGGGGSGGGGAVGAGSPNQIASGPGTRDSGGPGGTGLTSSITGSAVGYGGGGGGGSGGVPCGQGGSAGQGGGAGAASSGTPGTGDGTAGTVNTGGGGGAGFDNVEGKAGGSGIVIIRYKFQ